MSLPWIRVEDALPDPSETVLFVNTTSLTSAGDVRRLCLGHKDSAGPEHRLWYDESRLDRDGMYTDCYRVSHWCSLGAALPTSP